MPLKKPPGRPSAMQTIDLISGPRVDIYVGAKKKHYGLPKALLCHYSKYFKRCFNGKLEEGAEQKLNLPEDSIRDFEMLLEYMLGEICKFSGEAVGEDAKKQCMRLLTYAGQYEVSGIDEAMYGHLKDALSYKAPTRGGSTAPPAARVTQADVELIFRVTAEGSTLRSLIAKDVISKTGIKNLILFHGLEMQVDECAAELLREVSNCIRNLAIQWQDPLTSAKRSD